MSVTRRGRPKGSSTSVLRNTDRLGLADFAFLRAIIEGVNPEKAASRYLGLEAKDRREVMTAFKRRLRLAKAMMLAMHRVDAGELHQVQSLLDLGNASHASLAELLPAGEQASQQADDAPAWVDVPDYDEYSQALRFAYSEEELLQKYHEEYGQYLKVGGAGQEQAQRRQRQLDGLNLLQLRLSPEPKGGDPIELWLAERMCERLRPLGVLTLDDCIAAINSRGRTWYRELEGVGVRQAQCLVQWLAEHQAGWQNQLSARVCSPATSSTGLAVVTPKALMPREGGIPQFLVGMPVGEGMSLRTSGPNALGAHTDWQAYSAWLKLLNLKSAATRKAYERDVNRLLWWASERGKRLSELTVDDAVEHVHFLRNPPAHWVNPLRARQTEYDWRPMRGALSTSSIQRALAAIQNFYGFLVNNHYLLANPFAQIPVGQNRRRKERIPSLSEVQMQGVEDALRAIKDDKARRRMQAVLALLGLGLRRAELIAARWSHVQYEGGHLVLNVLGKGQRERLIPLTEAAMAALRAHQQDRIQLEYEGRLPALEGQESNRALICALQPVKTGRACPSGAISADNLHTLLKRLFAKAAQESDWQIKQASAHWLRHTFAKRLLKATGNDLAVTQKLLGHASIATTGIYVQADVTDRVEAIQKLYGGKD